MKMNKNDCTFFDMKYEDMLNYLSHADRENHKYVAKVKLSSGKYRYFYSQEEYNAYLHEDSSKSKDSSKKSDSLLDKIGSWLNKNIAQPVSTFLQGAQKTIKKGFDFVSNVAKTKISTLSKNAISAGSDFVEFVKSGGHKYIAKIELSNGSYRYFYDQAEYDRYLNKQKYQSNEPDFMKSIPETDDSETFEESMSKINEQWPYGQDTDIYSKYEAWDYSSSAGLYYWTEKAINQMKNLGYTDFSDEAVQKYLDETAGYYNNCADCTIAYELRERGYDVKAISNENGEPESRYADCFEGTVSHAYGDGTYTGSDGNGGEIKTSDSFVEDFKEAISKEPVGSRGDLSCQYSYGGGHSVSYSVESDGSVMIHDNQTNDSYTLDDYLNYSGHGDAASESFTLLTYTRLDNAELKEGVLDYVDVYS